MCFEVKAGRSCWWTGRMWEMREEPSNRKGEQAWGRALGIEVPCRYLASCHVCCEWYYCGDLGGKIGAQTPSVGFSHRMRGKLWDEMGSPGTGLGIKKYKNLELQGVCTFRHQAERRSRHSLEEGAGTEAAGGWGDSGARGISEESALGRRKCSAAHTKLFTCVCERWWSI